jgi:hypothetical protein
MFYFSDIYCDAHQQDDKWIAATVPSISRIRYAVVLGQAKLDT